MLDFIVIGGGLAGTILTDLLSRNGCNVCLIDEKAGSEGSKVAAGIYNPVTGRRMVKSWNIDSLNPYALKYYREKQEKLGKSFLEEINIKRIFHNSEQRKEWLEKVDFYSISEIVADEIAPDAEHPRLHLDNGGVETKESWRLDTTTFLDALHVEFTEQSIYQKGSIHYDKISIHNEILSIGDTQTRNLIFCEGYRMVNNPWFNFLTLVPNKGELLTIKVPSLKQMDLIQKGFFILPLGNDHYKVGATYNKEKVDLKPTQKAKDWLLTKLDKTIKVPYEILNHQVGIRPTSKDRRPMVGQHPYFRHLGLFNGFGSKGVSQIPWCAQQFINHYLDDKPLPTDIDINRFKEAYSGR